MPRCGYCRRLVACTARATSTFHFEGLADGQTDGFRTAGDGEIETEVLMRAPVPLDDGGVLDRARCRVVRATAGVAHGCDGFPRTAGGRGRA